MRIMTKEKFRWIDENIVIDFKIPSWWEEEFKMLEQMDREENMAYLVIAADLEDRIHEDVLSGYLTSKQVDIINRKFYGRKVSEWEEKYENR